MKNKNRKVFCQDCAFERDKCCGHPNNLMDDAYAPKHSHNNYAEYINGKNDCGWFKRYQATDKG